MCGILFNPNTQRPFKSTKVMGPQSTEIICRLIRNDFDNPETSYLRRLELIQTLDDLLSNQESKTMRQYREEMYNELNQ